MKKEQKELKLKKKRIYAKNQLAMKYSPPQQLFNH